MVLPSTEFCLAPITVSAATHIPFPHWISTKRPSIANVLNEHTGACERMQEPWTNFNSEPIKKFFPSFFVSAGVDGHADV